MGGIFISSLILTNRDYTSNLISFLNELPLAAAVFNIFDEKILFLIIPIKANNTYHLDAIDI